MKRFLVGACLLVTWPVEARDLSFEDRVRAQTAIERVRWNARIWPQQNPGPKPSFEETVPQALIRSKVETYLRKSRVLESQWNREVTSQALQAELERMARATQAPRLLSQLFRALDDDPELIAETLAREVLVNRLVHHAYQHDERLHAAGQSEDQWWAGAAPGLSFEIAPALGDYRLPTIRDGEDCMPDSWRPLDTAPMQRGGHSSVWTGSEMIVWGGLINLSVFSPNDYLNSGGRYDPATDTWEPMSLAGVPAPRINAHAVWTGSEMIVWGGNDLDGPMADGGRYDPASDLWSQVVTTGAPAARSASTVVWTGSKMIVWGGTVDGAYTATGAAYDASSNSWAPTTTLGAIARARHSAVWTGTQMIVWGGQAESGYLDLGARYDPIGDTWTPTGGHAPDGRMFHTAIWTGSRMVVWGGFNASGTLNSGGTYDPTNNTWQPTALVGAPVGRIRHSVVSSGSRMIVWGGQRLQGSVYIALDSGGLYDPVSNTWIATATSGAPSPRHAHRAVWTGTEMIVWGGVGTQNGGRYDPQTNSWIGMAGNEIPYPRAGHTTVWTGAEMIVWGGAGKTGGRYEPATDAWSPTATAGAPEERIYHTALWTGSVMIVYGGIDGSECYSIYGGGRYDPVNDTWAPLTHSPAAGVTYHTTVWTGTRMIVSGGAAWIDDCRVYLYGIGSALYDPASDTWTSGTTAGSPAPRLNHTSVWTGTEMLVWGGFPFALGGRYSPTSDSWAPLSQSGAPAPRSRHTAVWTGSEMIVWGGWDEASGGVQLGSGGRYDPVSDTWLATTSVGAPPPRLMHEAVWTGAEMILWGGIAYAPPGNQTYFGDGARYNPYVDTWSPTPVTLAPSGRVEHTAVWTGSEMIVWGGLTDQTVVNDGRMYCAVTEIDSDADDVLDAVDCAPADPTAWAPPGPARDLEASDVAWSWMPPFDPGSANLVYDVLRSVEAPAFSSPACLVEGTAATSSPDDWLVPSPGGAYFYLVRSVNGCGSNLGTGSSGTPRIGGDCRE